MNNYITFDGKKYKTVGSNWVETEVSPRQLKRLLSSAGDVSFCASSHFSWKGTIIADNTPVTGFGMLTDLETALRKKTPLTMIDHYGTTRSVTMSGVMEKRSTLPDWNSPSNEWHIGVEIETL